MTQSKHIGALYIAIILLISTIVIMNCSGSKKSEKLIIPERSGMLEDLTPKEQLQDSIFVYKLRDTIIKYSNPVDTVYIKEFVKANEVSKTEKYIDAIGKRTYSNVVEDSVLKLNYTAHTEGKLLDIKFDYTVKPFSIEQPKQKEEVFALYGGAGLQSTTDLQKVTPIVSIGFQNKKGDIIYGQYGTDNSIQVGYMTKIFKIKK